MSSQINCLPIALNALSDTKLAVGYCSYKWHKGVITNEIMRFRKCNIKCRYFSEFSLNNLKKEKYRKKYTKAERLNLIRQEVKKQNYPVTILSISGYTDKPGFYIKYCRSEDVNINLAELKYKLQPILNGDLTFIEEDVSATAQAVADDSEAFIYITKHKCDSDSITFLYDALTIQDLSCLANKLSSHFDIKVKFEDERKNLLNHIQQLCYNAGYDMEISGYSFDTYNRICNIYYSSECKFTDDINIKQEIENIYRCTAYFISKPKRKE